MISVVCVYNDRGVLNDYLLKSLKAQTTPYESVLLNNTDRAYRSAAQALNMGGLRAKGRYILFAHQDVSVSSPDWIANAEKLLERIPNVGIAGIAGISENGRNNRERRRNVILEHENPVTEWGNPITKPELVQTVDECLTIVPKDIFDVYHFDEKTCDDWHHYTVDYSLTVRSHGLNVVVLPLLVHHRSLGFGLKLTPRMDSIKEIQRYYRSLEKIVAKHRTRYQWIYTTNGDYNTSRNLYYQDLKRLPSILALRRPFGTTSR